MSARYCYRCDKSISMRGFPSHLKMHEIRHEDCRVVFPDGSVITYQYSLIEGDPIETNTIRSERLYKECNEKLSINTIRSRIIRGWTDERIVNTSASYRPKPKRSHPYKDASYLKMVDRKNREHKKR